MSEKERGKECVVAAAYGTEKAAAGGRRVGVAGCVVVGVALGFAVLVGW